MVSNVLGDTTAVFALGLSTIGQAISMAVLIFSGPLDIGLPRAVSSFCIAGGIVAMYVAWRSQIVPAASVIQDSPAIVMVAVAATVGVADGVAAVSDVFVLLAITTLSTGLIMWLLGYLKLGGLVRYMPATVVGAFMAGTGYLLVKGGLDVMVGFGVELSDIADLGSGELLKFWVPGFALGAVTWLISRSERLPVTAIGLTVVACLIGFYVIVAAASTVDAVQAGGWLIGPFPDRVSPSFVSPGELADSDWGRIASALPGIISVVAVSVMVMLLNMTGLTLQSSDRFDVDAELRETGVANIAVAALGPSPGFHGLGDTLLLKRIGATRRVIPLITGVILIIFGVLGVGLVGYVPRFVVGALLITVGAGLLEDWIKDLAHAVSRVEQVLSIAIVVVIALVGILEGIGAGLVAACGVFIVRYSRVDPIRVGGTGPAIRSRVDRTPAQIQALQGRASRLAVFELQGYLFFGSLTMLEDRFHNSRTNSDTDSPDIDSPDIDSPDIDSPDIDSPDIDSPDIDSPDIDSPDIDSPDTESPGASNGLDVVVLDFATVTGIDTAGYALISQLARQLHDAGTLVVISSLDDPLRDSLTAALPKLDDYAEWAPTLDHALELSENAQLALADQDTEVPEEEPLPLTDALLAEFDEVAFEAGEVVLEQGDDSDGMFIVVSGTMTAFRRDEAGVSHRLRRFGADAMVGEIGLVTGGVRTAQIVAETDVQALWLSNRQYEAMRGQDPELVFELHEFIMRGQAARVISLSEGLTRSTR